MNRCEAFLKALVGRGASAALIHRPENIRWLTGYTGADIDRLIADGVTYGDFFRGAPALNPRRTLIRGSICGVRIEQIDDPLMQDIRRLDKLIDDLARGKPLERLLPE